MASLLRTSHLGNFLGDDHGFDEAKATAQVCLAQLYLPGCHRPLLSPRVQASALSHLILETAPRGRIAVIEALRANGFRNEAFILGEPESLLAVKQAMNSLPPGCAILTAADGHFPAAWTSPGRNLALPCIFVAGNQDLLGFASSRPLPASGGRIDFKGRLIGVVGSSHPSVPTIKVAKRLGQWVADQGAILVSGGAPGVDQLAETAALKAGGSVIEIRPCGIQVPWGVTRSHSNALSYGHRWLGISGCPLNAPFTVPAAMERNAQIYALSALTFVLEPRYKTGGSWHGATRALQSRLGGVVVSHRESSAHLALTSLGAWTFQFQPRPPFPPRKSDEPAARHEPNSASSFYQGGLALFPARQSLFEALDF